MDQVPGARCSGSFAIMETMETRALIDMLRTELQHQLVRCAELRQLPLAMLHERPTPDRWSVMEVLQHMNLSSGHYLQILTRLYADENNRLRFRSSFTPGRWGDYFTNAMQPSQEGAISWRMRTMDRFTPSPGEVVEWKALDAFEAMCHSFIGLLERARTRGLEGEKVTSTLGPILRLKVGDAFRFPIAHQTRHMLQIQRVLHTLTELEAAR